LMAAKGYKEVGEWPQGRWGHVPTLGRVRIGFNLIHSPLGQNRVTQHRGWKGLCTKSTIAVDSEQVWRWFQVLWKVDLISFSGNTWTSKQSPDEVVVAIPSCVSPAVRIQPAQCLFPFDPIHCSWIKQECTCLHCLNMMNLSLRVNLLDG
jgi:hypothetical protein